MVIYIKILCLNPSFKVHITWGKPQVNQPLGLAYIAGALQAKNEVIFLDANAEKFDNLKKMDGYYYSGLSTEEIVNKVVQINPEIICMSITFTVNSINSLEILDKIKKSLPKVTTIVGGAHVTVRPKETLSNENVDIIVIGEGDKTILELLDCLSNKGNMNDIKGIGFKDGKQLIINEPRDLIRNLDELPFPALDLLPLDNYFNAYKQGRSQRKAYTYNQKWTSIITSRGCPMNCIFCSVHLTMGKLYRSRSPENVIAEIERDYIKFGIKHFNLEDDNMSWSIPRFQKICDMIIEKKFDITWAAPNGIRADRIDEETVKKMKNSGCKRVFVAPESGSQRVLTEVIDKRMKLQDVEKAVELFVKYKINVDLSFVIGLPGETKEEIIQSILFAKKLRRKGASTVGFNIATPLYGTRLYNIAVENGYFDVTTDPSKLSPSEALIDTPEWSKKEVLYLHDVADWYVNFPWFRKIIHLLRNPKKIRNYLEFFVTNFKF